MTRKIQVKDVDGRLWDVAESRPTKHGFDLHFGWPSDARGYGQGAKGLIPTQDLLKYWESKKLCRDGSIYDLPIGRTSIKRVRSILGLDYYTDNAEWYWDRIEDLMTMSNVRFSAIHGVDESTVSVVRSKLLGRRIREAFWWREESVADLLCSDLPRFHVASKLGISIGAVGRMRWLLRKERDAAPLK